jgi:hypothetical protein
MNLDFYAVDDDITSLLDYVFEKGFNVYESYSRFDHELRQFSSTSQVLSAYDEDPGDQLSLVLVHPSVAGKTSIKYIQLKPGSCHGYTFRYCVEGWGLMQLYLAHMQNDNAISVSHFGHQSVERALAFESTCLEYGDVWAWDWKGMTKLSSAVKYHITNKLSPKKKHHSRPILHAALRLVEDKGYTLKMN